MRIVCPECQFAQEIPEDKIPARAQLATCPRCKFKFRFRELDDQQAEPTEHAEQEQPTREEHATPGQPETATASSPEETPQPAADEPATQQADETPAGTDAHDDHFDDAAHEEASPTPHKAEDEDDLPPFPDHASPRPDVEPDRAKDIWQALDDMAPTEAEERDSAPAGEQEQQARGEEAPSQRERMDAAQAYLKARQEEETPDRVVVDVPFERPEKYGFFPGLLKTYQRALFSPRLFFRVMPLNGYVKPIAFYIILSLTLIGLQMLWQKLGFVPTTDPLTQESMSPQALTLKVFMQNMLLFPVLSCSLMLGVSSLLHIFLSMLKGASAGFEGTVRAMAYSSAPTILLALPSFNQTGYAVVNSVAVVWGLALTFIACKHIHRTSYPKVILGLLLAMLALALLMTFFIMGGQGPATI